MVACSMAGRKLWLAMIGWRGKAPVAEVVSLSVRKGKESVHATCVLGFEDGIQIIWQSC